MPVLADVAGAGPAGAGAGAGAGVGVGVGVESEADFAYPRDRVLGEFDGWEEFGRSPGPAPPGWRRELVIAAERARHELLIASGWRVVRWTWADLARPAELIATMREALARSGGVTGTERKS